MKQYIIHTVGCIVNEEYDETAAYDRLMELFSQGYELVRSIKDISGRVFITVRKGDGMTINQLFVAMTGWYTDTRVSVYTFENANWYYEKNEEHAAIVNGILAVQACGYGVKRIAAFRVHQVSESGFVKHVSILLEEGV